MRVQSWYTHSLKGWVSAAMQGRCCVAFDATEVHPILADDAEPPLRVLGFPVGFGSCQNMSHGTSKKGPSGESATRGAISIMLSAPWFPQALNPAGPYVNPTQSLRCPTDATLLELFVKVRASDDSTPMLLFLGLSV